MMFATLLCKIGLHKRGPWQRVSVFHSGEYPWERWTHLCQAVVRGDCTRCGLPSDRKKRLCSDPVLVGPTQVRGGGLDWSDVPEGNKQAFREAGWL